MTASSCQPKKNRYRFILCCGAWLLVPYQDRTGSPVWRDVVNKRKSKTDMSRMAPYEIAVPRSSERPMTCSRLLCYLDSASTQFSCFKMGGKRTCLLGKIGKCSTRRRGKSLFTVPGEKERRFAWLEAVQWPNDYPVPDHAE